MKTNLMNNPFLKTIEYVLDFVVTQQKLLFFMKIFSEWLVSFLGIWA